MYIFIIYSPMYICAYFHHRFYDSYSIEASNQVFILETVDNFVSLAKQFLDVQAI